MQRPVKLQIIQEQGSGAYFKKWVRDHAETPPKLTAIEQLKLLASPTPVLDALADISLEKTYIIPLDTDKPAALSSVTPVPQTAPASFIRYPHIGTQPLQMLYNALCEHVLLLSDLPDILYIHSRHLPALRAQYKAIRGVDFKAGYHFLYHGEIKLIPVFTEDLIANELKASIGAIDREEVIAVLPLY